jgi:NAD(P)-dependent dehydrogenase (short-subunit alcohol dehydrogenase family)
MKDTLDGQVAIVTGASRGIGEGIALALAEAGAAVGVADVDEKTAAATVRKIEAAGGKAVAVRVDVTEFAQVQEMVSRTAAAFGAVDILVNNAGIATTQLVEDLDEAAWRRVLDVNLTGPFLCSKAVLPGMRERGWGRIVNIASVAAKRLSFTAAASYTASKEGLLGFTRHLAYVVAPHGINVNAICPGPTLTAMYQRNADEETRRDRVAMVPQGRFLTPQDHGRVAVFLCSEAASPLCGLAIDVDGGSLLGWMPWEKYMAKRKRK